MGGISAPQHREKGASIECEELTWEEAAQPPPNLMGLHSGTGPGSVKPLQVHIMSGSSCQEEKSLLFPAAPEARFAVGSYPALTRAVTASHGLH